MLLCTCVDLCVVGRMCSFFVTGIRISVTVIRLCYWSDKYLVVSFIMAFFKQFVVHVAKHAVDVELTVCVIRNFSLLIFTLIFSAALLYTF